MPNSLSLTYFKSVLDNMAGGNQTEVTWEAFAKRMQRFEVLTNKKQGGAWSPVRFATLEGYRFIKEVEETNRNTGEIKKLKLWQNPENREVLTDDKDQVLRRDMNVRQVFMAVLDLDHQEEAPEALLAPWKAFNYIFHTTFSHRPDEGDGRYRLIMPFPEPVTDIEFRRIWPVLFEMSGRRMDEKCGNLSRIYFFPSHHPDRKAQAFAWTHSEGKYLTISQKAILDVEKALKAQEKAAKPSTKPVSRNLTPYGERGDYRTLDGVGWFQAHGMFIGPAGKTGKYFVKCPWASEHTNGVANPEDTVLYEDPGRWPTFACSHSHCKGRDIRQVNELWGDIDSYCAKKLEPAKIKAQLQEEVKVSIRCLGYEPDPKRYWYQCSETDSITKLKADQHKKLNLWSITGETDYWAAKYGQEQDGALKINWEMAAHDLITQGNRVGPIRPEMSMRGLGVAEDAGRIVAHLGRSLLVDGRFTPITKIKSDFIYERSFPEIKLTAPASLSEAQKVFALVERLSIPKQSEKVLLAGQLVAGYLCGMLEYRPHCWLVGMPDSGKSATMREVIAKLWSPVGGLFREEKTTAAGIRQALKYNTVPVAIDEAEAMGRDEIQRIASLVNLARSATSSSEFGGTGQGRPSGEAMGFRVRSCFVFASISAGLLAAQDKQRFSIINFRSRKEDVDAWPAFRKDLRATLTSDFAIRFYHRAITMAKVVQENIDTFYSVITQKMPTVTARFANHVGTLLACAYTYFSDTAASPDEAWAFFDRLGDWEDYRLDKFEENNAHQVYALLMTHQIQEGIHRKTIAELIEEAMNPAILSGDSGKVLRRFGIKADAMEKRVFVANSHPTLVDLMSNRGIINHNMILREYPGAVVSKDPVRLDTSSATYRGIWIPYQGANDASLPPAPVQSAAPVGKDAAGSTTAGEEPELAF